MRWLFGSLGAFIVGWLGWWLGAKVNLVTAFIVSMVGTGVGLYLGRKLFQDYLG
ncbi:MAG: hypothetical protein L0196_09930 [candidate division Zixibacteria bacterium]|nr:hypothetical protein [candidate division Zixibacteria bacterium]